LISKHVTVALAE